MSRAGAVVFLVASTALADPAPTQVDPRPFRAELLVFADAANNHYVVKPAKLDPPEPARLWFGPAGKPLYEQTVTGRTANGPAWSVNVWAPRIPGVRPGYVRHLEDGSYDKLCGDRPSVPLTQLTGDKAKAVLDKSPLMTELLQRRAHLLARDDSGTYYYVDKMSPALGGRGFRVFMGKKGAMKQLPLTDVASDTAGEVFSTKSGDLRLHHQATTERDVADKMTWVRGEKRFELIVLDVHANSPVIFTDLGIYPFLGTICDNM